MYVAVQTSPIELKHIQPFSKGGNRLCFVSPTDKNVCLKVHQSIRTPEIRKKRKSFPGNLRSVDFFDENLQEYHSLQQYHAQFPEGFCRHLPKSYGLVETDLGTAHSMELIRDQDGLISETIELYLWSNGRDALIEKALEAFKDAWLTHLPRSRDLLPHNLVIQKNSTGAKIIIIDGYGRKPKQFLRGRFAIKKATTRLEKLDQRIQTVLERKELNQPKTRLGNLQRDL